MMTGLKVIERTNFRHRKAEQMTAALMCELDGVLGDCDRNSVSNRLFSVLYDSGAGWTTDEERAVLSMEPRDALGWTESEYAADQKQRSEIMRSLAAIDEERIAFLALEDWPEGHTGRKVAFCLAWLVTAPVAVAVGLITAFLDIGEYDD